MFVVSLFRSSPAAAGCVLQLSTVYNIQSFTQQMVSSHTKDRHLGGLLRFMGKFFFLFGQKRHKLFVFSLSIHKLLLRNIL